MSNLKDRFEDIAVKVSKARLFLNHRLEKLEDLKGKVHPDTYTIYKYTVYKDIVRDLTVLYNEIDTLHEDLEGQNVPKTGWEAILEGKEVLAELIHDGAVIINDLKRKYRFR